MPKAPCNMICESGCSSQKGCPLNLLDPCSEFCVDPPQGEAAMATAGPGVTVQVTQTPASALLAFLLRDPLAEKARRELLAAIQSRPKEKKPKRD